MQVCDVILYLVDGVDAEKQINHKILENEKLY